jgi:hypothetical protein
MTMPKKIVAMFFALFTAVVLLPATGCGTASSDSVKSVDAGATWEVSETTRLTGLTIAEGAEVTAPEGYLLTMTVNQVETGVAPGSYEGDIVLTPTVPIHMTDSMHGGDYYLRTAVYVEDGAVVRDKSVLSAVAGGEVADMAVVGTGGDSVFTENTVVNSRRFGVMYHGSGDITIDKGSIFNTKSTAIQLKSPGHTVLVDSAEINAENGILLQVMANDENSRWVVDETCYLTSLTLAEGSSVTGPDGAGVTVTVDGVPTPLRTGDYKGTIVLTVAGGA